MQNIAVSNGSIQRLVYPLQRLLHVLHVTGTHRNVILAQPQVVLQAPDVGIRHKPRAQQAMRVQRRQPLAVRHVGLAPRQIAGLLARRIVFWKAVGESAARGERVGLIKFGSRVDVFFDPDARVQVKVGDHVRGGATILALLPAVVAAGPVSRQEQPLRKQWSLVSPGAGRD